MLIRAARRSFCTIALAGLLPAAMAGTEPYRHVVSEDTLNYLLHLPAGYEDGAETFPLLLFLHGIGQKGNGSADAIHKVAVDGPFRAMREGQWNAQLPLIVVGPQAGGVQPWWPGAEVKKVLEHVKSSYRVDVRRIYLSGISMGGRSAWWLANTVPAQFAALVPTSAWAGDLSDSCEKLSHLGIWAFHGANDPLIGLSAGRKPIDTLAGCTPALETPPRLTVLQDVGHGDWDLVYLNRHGDSHRGADGRDYEDIYEWMLTFSSVR